MLWSSVDVVYVAYVVYVVLDWKVEAYVGELEVEWVLGRQDADIREDVDGEDDHA